jgi:hypothetical protein
MMAVPTPPPGRGGGDGGCQDIKDEGATVCVVVGASAIGKYGASKGCERRGRRRRGGVGRDEGQENNKMMMMIDAAICRCRATRWPKNVTINLIGRNQPEMARCAGDEVGDMGGDSGGERSATKGDTTTTMTR